MDEAKFVKVIFTDEEWKWLEHHMAALSDDDEMVLNVRSALDDGTVYESKKED